MIGGAKVESESTEPVKQLNPNEVALMLQEEIIERFTWGFEQKEVADRFRRAVDSALKRRDMTKDYNVTVSLTVLVGVYSVRHLVHVEKRHETEN